jgi:hypothetical protein
MGIQFNTSSVTINYLSSRYFAAFRLPPDCVNPGQAESGYMIRHLLRVNPGRTCCRFQVSGMPFTQNRMQTLS